MNIFFLERHFSEGISEENQHHQQGPNDQCKPNSPGEHSIDSIQSFTPRTPNTSGGSFGTETVPHCSCPTLANHSVETDCGGLSAGLAVLVSTDPAWRNAMVSLARVGRISSTGVLYRSLVSSGTLVGSAQLWAAWQCVRPLRARCHFDLGRAHGALPTQFRERILRPKKLWKNTGWMMNGSCVMQLGPARTCVKTR